MFPASEEHEMFAVQVEGRYVVADYLYGLRRCFLYSLPHFFKDDLSIHRKGRDVFVNRREALLSVICVSPFGLPASSPATRRPASTGNWKGQTACRPIHLIQAPLLEVAPVRAEAAGRHMPERIEPS
jgi:hypothetical protein